MLCMNCLHSMGTIHMCVTGTVPPTEAGLPEGTLRSAELNCAGGHVSLLPRSSSSNCEAVGPWKKRHNNMLDNRRSVLKSVDQLPAVACPGHRNTLEKDPRRVDADLHRAPTLGPAVQTLSTNSSSSPHDSPRADPADALSQTLRWTRSSAGARGRCRRWRLRLRPGRKVCGARSGGRAGRKGTMRWPRAEVEGSPRERAWPVGATHRGVWMEWSPRYDRPRFRGSFSTCGAW